MQNRIEEKTLTEIKKTTLACQKKKTESKLSNNFHSHKWQLGIMEPNFCFFFYQTGFCHYLTDLFGRRFRYTIASILEQKNPHVFCFSFAEVWFSDWVRLFLHQYRQYIPAFFCGTSAGLTVFRWKIAAVNLNSQQNFDDNSSSEVLRRVTAVSEESPVIVEKNSDIARQKISGKN